MKRATALTFIALILIFSTMAATAVSTQQPENVKAALEAQEQQEDIVRVFAEEGAEGPMGEWWVAALPDKTQKENTSVPAFITSTLAFTARGRFSNLILSEVMIKNRTRQAIKAVRLKWALTMVNNPFLPIATGRTAILHIAVGNRETKSTKTPRINFAKITKTLLRNGVLEG